MKKGFKALISILSVPLAITLFSKEAKADVARSADGTSFVNVELVAENNKIVLDKPIFNDEIKVEDVATINFLRENYVEVYDKGNNRHEGELLTNVQFRQGDGIRGMDGIKQYAVTNGVMADEDVAKSLDLVEKARLYEKSLGLESYNFDYYNDFDTRKLYILAAAPKLELKRSYNDMYRLESYDINEIQEERIELEKEGYDVYVRSVEAIATGNYPITPDFVEASIFRQAYLVFHEDFHNNSEAALSLQEAMGNVVGHFGGLELTGLLYGKSSKEYEQAKGSLSFYETLDDLIVYYYDKLDKLYSSSLPNKIKMREKGKILSQARLDFLELGFTADINNAFFSSLITYSRYHDLAEKVYRKAGSLEETTKVFKAVPSDEEKGVKYLEGYLRD